MLSLPPTVRVFVAVAPLDMRGSFDAVAGAVRRLGLDPVNGHLYLFLNKRRRLAKALLSGVGLVPPCETSRGRELSAATTTTPTDGSCAARAARTPAMTSTRRRSNTPTTPGTV